MSPLNDSPIHKEVEGLKRYARQWARKYRENESLEQVEECKKKS